jgi:putative peptide zinc metalloprotease protein
MSNVVNLQSIRPLRRSDLEIICRNCGDAGNDEEWIVKDPVQLNYFFLDRVQHWLFERLDGSSSLQEIQQTFSKAFSGNKISEQQLLNFCMRLGRDGLLCEPVSGERLLQRQKQQRKVPLYKLPMSLLAIRLPGFNAGALISLADTLFGWIFAPSMVLIAIIWLTITFVFGIQLLDEIVWSLPSLANVSFADVVLLLVCVSAVKIIHELGHAVCCRRMGANCNEIGVMFLVFSPCLYCNVTDSWMLPSRWRRIAVAAAGIYIELLIASISLVLWYYAETEFLKSLFFNLMIVCSVSTLLVNGNPLMRYDGYFILSDLIGVPNLSQQARSAAWDWFVQPFFRVRQSIGSQRHRSSSIFLVGYYVASIAYRAFILTAIFMIVHALLEPIGLQNVAATMAIVYVACFVTAFVFSLIPMLKTKNQRGQKNWLGIAMTLLLLGGLGWFILNVKVAHSINSSARIEFEEIATCTARTGGTLEWTIQKGAFVEEGEPVARLSNFRSATERTKLIHRIELAKLKIDNLTSRSGIDSDSRIALPSAESELSALTDELTMLDQRQKELEIVAPMSGIVVESYKRPKDEGSQIKLANWRGSALEQANLGCSIKHGETVCLIAKRDNWKAVLLIDEKKRDLVAGGERVTIRTSLERSRRYVGTIGKVFSDVDVNEVTGQRSFRAKVLLDEPISIGFHGASGKARVTIEQQTLWETCRRFILESFRFEI